MKRILTIILAVAFALSTSGTASAQMLRKDVTVNLSEIHLDASFKQFKKADKTNQSEVLTELLRQANVAYVECETIEEVYELKELVALIQRYQDSAKQSFMSVQHQINTLNTKINKTIRKYEGGTSDFNNKEYQDRGQDE